MELRDRVPGRYPTRERSHGERTEERQNSQISRSQCEAVETLFERVVGAVQEETGG